MRKRLARFKQWLSVCCLLLVLALFLTSVSHAQMTLEDLDAFLQSQYGRSIADLQIPDLDIIYGNNLSMTCPVEFDLLAKAQPDECYNGPCGPNNKVNQAYVWGMTIDEDGKIWFGTAPNTHCLVLSGYLGLSGGLETDSYVCEGGLSDWRAPEIYSYDPKTETLTKHPTLEEISNNPTLATIFDTTLGIRSAGSSGDIIFLAGPKLPPANGVNLFAYDTDGNYLGSADLNTCITNETLNANNIRKWLAVSGTLYTAIGSSQGGRVLKWTGTKEDPFNFAVVGALDNGSGAELAYHDGRIFVSTWPGGQGAGFNFAGLFMSPVIGDGLDGDDADGWIKIWQATDYEPDMITAGTYGGGALASFDGQLYWGTMHVPMLSFAAYLQSPVFSPDGEEDFPAALLGSYRAISIFRGGNFADDGSFDIDLLYGMPQLPAYRPFGEGQYEWQLVNNKMYDSLNPQKHIPLFGPSGFGNMFNNYTWSMQVFGGKLWIGTMDWSYIIGDLTTEMLQQLAIEQPGFQIPELPESLTNLPKYFYGADLFCMASPDAPALPLCLSGLGNYTNYGIRNMVADNEKIYFGMANPMNLLTDLTDDLPEGGWELLSRGDLEVDGDLVSADIEDMAPNGGDGNFDQIPDSQQLNVASIRPNNSSNFITVEVSEESDCSQIRGIMPVPDDFLPLDDGYSHPFGNIHIMLQCPDLSGGSATIRIYYHGGGSSYGLEYRKFGATTPNSLPIWYTYPNARFGRENGVLFAELTLTDDDLGDLLWRDNGGDGFIIDPGGPARAGSLSIPTLSEWGMILTMILLGLTGIFYMRKRPITKFD